jgi:1,6-anhydro-N-acetylmuramate kinase
MLFIRGNSAAGISSAAENTNYQCRGISDVGEHMQTVTPNADPVFGADLRVSLSASPDPLASTSHKSSLEGARQSFARAAWKSVSGLITHEWAHESQAAQ